ncbi:hypothetical protein S7711_01038 [Stachybotrys chartarum IBT 7711]|uniref:Helicase ATP-binding domain-containing protein n=1 Tax=Stachybotrys chartarum (strain CBS 109288 / IBT 7711) TaxID=1280523 RepID=A0A084B477_STACB|nr:hypothetical protein S7711_01038 [Stachybotrys chartarum IBT 7711]
MDSIKRNEATMAQIQRLEDAPLNPLTGQAWPAGHDEILQSRRNLPVYQRFEEILDVYHNNQVFVLSSETGSGKSTQIPQLLMYDEYASGLKVACTQPHRLATTSLADRAAKELGVDLGRDVGYLTGGDKAVSSPDEDKKTRLVYMTEGVLLGHQADNADLSDYACVVVDEAHERTIEMDLLLALLKKSLRNRQDLKVVIMSATMDVKLFQDYFNDCPLVHITGRNFQVDITYLSPSGASSDLTVLTARVVLHIHKNKGQGHILVFLPGKDEIAEVCRLLSKYAENLDVFPLYSALAVDQQHSALYFSSQNRKCIVSTNVAETGLTINGLGYVVDSGLSRQMIYNPRLDMNMLSVLPISQATAKQRMNCVGRTRDGVCHRLYSKESFDNMPLSTDSAIRCQSVHSAILRLLAAGHVKILDFDWVEAPHPDSISRAAQDLHDWEFINDAGQITTSGRKASRCLMEPIWFRAIEKAAKLNCAMDMLDIAVLCSTQRHIYARPPKYKRVADATRSSLAAWPSDHLALANAFNMYMRKREAYHEANLTDSSLDDWCTQHFLDSGMLEQARELRDKVGRFIKRNTNLAPRRASMQDRLVIHQALAVTFCTRVALYHGSDDEYRTVPENVAARLNPHSSLIGGNYTWIIYTNLTMVGGHVYMNTATPIMVESLVDLPCFQDDRLPVKGDGSLRQPNVKKLLDEARARIRTSMAT